MRVVIAKSLHTFARHALAKAIVSQISDPDDHASFRIEWEILEIKATIEGSHGLVERVCENAEAADLAGEVDRCPKREQKQGAPKTATLISAIDGKLAKHYDRNGIGPVALCRFRQVCAFDLTDAQGNIGGDAAVRSIADDGRAR